MIRQFEAKLLELFPQIVAWRRHFHQYPELSFQEVNTPATIAGLLSDWGIEVKKGVGGNGVVGRLQGGLPGPTVALRADFDALPIQDEKQCEYKSTVPGVMHACGHDAHTATLLGVAKICAELRDELPGQLVFIFQHAEEVSPGGAISMIEDGVLEGVDAVYGVHLWTPIPYGKVSTKPGPFFAAADEFQIEILGKGGHGGLPHETTDSIVIGSHLVVNLQSIVSRSINPLDPAVVSVGTFQSGAAFNVIAERAILRGTVRSFAEPVRQLLRARVEETIDRTCAMFGAKYNLTYRMGYPPVVNHAQEAERFFRVAPSLFDASDVLESNPIMAGEDFAYYLERVPGCFMFVGAGNPDVGAVYGHHHARFDIEERAMLNAAKLLTAMALDYMGKSGRS